jgi:hypothetical protein
MVARRGNKAKKPFLRERTLLVVAKMIMKLRIKKARKEVHEKLGRWSGFSKLRTFLISQTIHQQSTFSRTGMPGLPLPYPPQPPQTLDPHQLLQPKHFHLFCEI